MKKINLIMVGIVIMFTSCITYTQEKRQSKVESLVQALNSDIGSDFYLELKWNKSAIGISQDAQTQTLDLRDAREIALDGYVRAKKKRDNKPSGRHRGVVFWKYNFRKVISSNVLFKPTKNQQIFCTISFNKKDTIIINSSQNVYSCNRRMVDAKSHTVQWIGDKYISLLLTPEWRGDEVVVEVQGITLGGKFQRTDEVAITNGYVKTLMKILKREFKKFFESKNIRNLLSKK